MMTGSNYSFWGGGGKKLSDKEWNLFYDFANCPSYIATSREKMLTFSNKIAARFILTKLIWVCGMYSAHMVCTVPIWYVQYPCV